MSSITSSVESLVSSVLGIFKNIFESILALFNAFFATGSTAISSAFDLFKAVLNFLLSNIFLMLLIGAGFFGYSMYLQRQRGQKIGGPGGKPLMEKGYAR